MLRSVREITGFKIRGTDDQIGHLHDLLFDDKSWTVRYLVVDTGKWLPGRKIVLSPVSVKAPEWEDAVIPVMLSVKQIEDSPGISEHEPVSRQNELELIKYYNWPLYWDLSSVNVPEMNFLAAQEVARQEMEEKKESGDENPHLRSSGEVRGYHIQAPDGDIGHVEDFLVEDESWMLRYIVVDTRDWLPGGKKVVISPAWIQEIDWALSQVKVDLPKEKIRNSPEYDASAPVKRGYEEKLHEHYGRPKYWK